MRHGILVWIGCHVVRMRAWRHCDSCSVAAITQLPGPHARHGIADRQEDSQRSEVLVWMLDGIPVTEAFRDPPRRDLLRPTPQRTCSRLQPTSQVQTACRQLLQDRATWCAEVQTWCLR
jgi:hypothetical protein